MPASERYAFGNFVLERSQQRVLHLDGTPLSLTPRLFSALLLFVEHAGELLDKDTLMTALWPGLVVEENNLSQVISGLRRALGDDPQGSRYIQTVPRRGFRFVAPVSLPATVDTAVNPGAAGIDLPQPGKRRWLGAALGVGVLGGIGGIGGAGWLGWRRSVPAEASAQGPSLAVMPFKPLMSEERDELLELGMADSLIARLSTVPGLVVRSTGSVRRYAGAEQDPLRAARELDVDWVVDGSLQRRGDQLRVTARLLRASDGVAAWSGSFDQQFTGVFDIQDQISNKVRDALVPALQSGAGTRAPLIELGGTRNTDAYQLYLAARWRAQGGRLQSIEKAIALLYQALDIDPAYALAWTELAWAHRRKLWNADAVPTEVFEAANAALQHALALVPRLPQAQAGVGFSRFWYDFDWPGGESEFRGALAANPNVSNAHWGLAQMLLTQGRINEGFSHMRRARELDPMSPVYNTLEASFLVSHGQLTEARQRLNRALDIAPDQWLAHVTLGLLYTAERRPDQGITALRRAVALAEGGTRPSAMLAVHLVGAGQADEARAILDRMLALAKQRFVPPTSLAAVHAALGETGLALTALERALVTRDTRLVYLSADPNWAPLRQEPRFVALLKALKLDRLPPGLSSA